jgi:chemotaxis protein MotB
MGRNGRKKGINLSPNLVQVMTLSLFIILLAFFILLNSLAVVDERRKRLAIGSLLENFGVLAGGFSMVEGSRGDKILGQFPIINSPIDFDEQLLEAAHIRPHKDGTALSISTQDLFEDQDIVLRPSSFGVLDRLCATMKKNAHPVEIVGHTDNLPREGQKPWRNRDLSALRALNVLEYLTEKGGIDRKRVTAYGWGAYRPAVANTTKETRALNRRIEIVFVHKRPFQKPKGGFTFRNFFFRIFE